jgi:hypothetical protein
MLAALAMYDWPELAAATDAWWSGLRRHLRDAGFRNVPETLDRSLSPMSSGGPPTSCWLRPAAIR